VSVRSPEPVSADPSARSHGAAALFRAEREGRNRFVAVQGVGTEQATASAGR
jgi:hypothetical protein